MPLPTINPPLLNSANPWCTSRSDLEALYKCPDTGAVTTRTSLLNGFPHDPAIHRHAFYTPSSQSAATAPDYTVDPAYSTSLNTLGYSPNPLHKYLTWISEIVSANPEVHKKPFVVSVTGTATEVAECYSKICALQTALPDLPLAMEVNLSCPNIAGKPPPAYSGAALKDYLVALAKAPRTVPVGLKTPPYTYAGQFEDLIGALRGVSPPVDFLTAINTLGSCLVLAASVEDPPSKGDQPYAPLLPSAAGTGIGGMAGESLHPLALGNVATLRRMLDACPELASVEIIGVGGVCDAAGFTRMQAAGAKLVGVGTALGREGTAVFAKIRNSTSCNQRARGQTDDTNSDSDLRAKL